MAGHHAAHKQRAHRCAGEHTVDDHGDGGGEDGADGGGGGGDGAAEFCVVALLLHLLNLHQADAGGVSDGGAGHAGENQGDQDVHLGGAALHTAQEAVTEVEHLVGNFRLVEHVGHKHEQRGGQHGKAGDHIAGDNGIQRVQAVGVGHQEVYDGGHHHGKRDGHTDDEADR